MSNFDKKDFPKNTHLTADIGGNVSDDEVHVAQSQNETKPTDLDEFLLDTHGHLIVKHDLFNHDGLTKDGIAEAFAEFAKKEKLSFF